MLWHQKHCGCSRVLPSCVPTTRFHAERGRIPVAWRWINPLTGAYNYLHYIRSVCVELPAEAAQLAVGRGRDVEEEPGSMPNTVSGGTGQPRKGNTEANACALHDILSLRHSRTQLCDQWRAHLFIHARGTHIAINCEVLSVGTPYLSLD